MMRGAVLCCFGHHVSEPVQRRRLFDPGLILIIILSSLGAVATYRAGGWSAVVAIVAEDSLLFVEILPKIAAGCLIGALITLLVPRETIVRLVGSESGWRGLMIATLAGILMPGGPFTIFPVTVAFLSVGADAGAAIAFVTAWHVIGLNRAIIWEMPFFGPHFVAQRVLVCLIFPVIIGFCARLFRRHFERKP